jgi:hypothetical protein
MFVRSCSTGSSSLDIVETKSWSDFGFILDGFFDERFRVDPSLLGWNPHQTALLGD